MDKVQIYEIIFINMDARIVEKLELKYPLSNEEYYEILKSIKEKCANYKIFISK